MARKFFNQKVKNKRKQMSIATIVIVGVVIILLIIALIALFSMNNSSKKNKNATIELRDKLAVEINSELPDKTLFFAELKGVKESDIKIDYNKVDLKKVGNYDVIIKLYGKEYKTKLDVVDTERPSLTLKDVSIALGEHYEAKDFVESCTDNSGEECQIAFYTLSLDQDGDNIDYSSYQKAGSYQVEIVATDASGNSTIPTGATLTIGKSNNQTNTCKYGDNKYDTNKYILAVDVTDKGCALDLNLYKSESIVAPVKALLAQEEEKLKKEFSKINLNVKNIYLDYNIAPVLNESGTGIVGYTLHIEVSVDASNNNKEIIESFYLNTDGKREYSINKYLN